jgi:excisionase family DNA binding protein
MPMNYDTRRPIHLSAYDDLVSVPEAAKRAGVMSTTIQTRIGRREVVAERFTGRAFIVSARSAIGHAIERAAFDRAVSELATVEEACRHLGVSEAYVPRLVARGSLDGFKLNARTWAITRESIARSAREYDPNGQKGQRRQPGLPGRRKPREPGASVTSAQLTEKSEVVLQATVELRVDEH